MASPKAPQLIQRYVTSGDRKLADWHLLLQRVTFGSALVLMFASVVSLHWACNLIGLTGWAEPIAWLVPLAIEVGMAATASTATTIRKNGKGYYLHLWVIFSFLMALAQFANIGHAITAVADTTTTLPEVIPSAAVYVFACAFAALFPLGGTMFVHVSGFLRAHGTGAGWIDESAEVVFEQVAPGAPATQSTATARKTVAPRAPSVPVARTEPAPERAQSARTETEVRAQSARASQPAPAQSAQPAPAAARNDPESRAREVFDQMVTDEPIRRPDAAQILREAGLTDGPNPATVRRWRNLWWVEHQRLLGIASPDPKVKELALPTTIDAATPAAEPAEPAEPVADEETKAPAEETSSAA